jgi:hypothetical protein
MRAEDAVQTLDSIEEDIKGLGLLGQTYQKLAPNFIQTQLGQIYDQAQRQFTEARLRKDSGAAIPPQEFENDRKTYFVQPGDTAATLKRKKAARDVLLNALKAESGNAARIEGGTSNPSGPQTAEEYLREIQGQP